MLFIWSFYLETTLRVFDLSYLQMFEFVAKRTSPRINPLEIAVTLHRGSLENATWSTFRHYDDSVKVKK
jgi:hypothetical protein